MLMTPTPTTVECGEITVRAAWRRKERGQGAGEGREQVSHHALETRGGSVPSNQESLRGLEKWDCDRHADLQKGCDAKVPAPHPISP